MVQELGALGEVQLLDVCGYDHSAGRPDLPCFILMDRLMELCELGEEVKKIDILYALDKVVETTVVLNSLEGDTYENAEECDKAHARLRELIETYVHEQTSYLLTYPVPE